MHNMSYYVQYCISSLLDAGAIFEVEKPSVSAQLYKKVRRAGAKSKDEVAAFHYTKDALIALLQQASTVQLAKDRILQITEYWRVNGNVSSTS